ncbi:hypothetical protein [Hymenobacter cellulosilyticus]|uniref:Uncharacterized protein n=1 Tax=Hymenobacter cellulosilyticus TaxID=2932248 RepID=A0A8T9QBV3_9BACT|nr:hypothetical protein [Hymenobacter cellulosilyticus]UOQ74675.1 hypothetical protein MUN79_12855 [Hymenobacter cellulosilyticus]
MSKLILIALLLLASSFARAQQQKLSAWQKEAGSLDDKVFDITYSSDDWVVCKVGTDIMVSRPKARYVPVRGDSLTIPMGRLKPEINYRYGVKVVKKVSDGFLVGIDDGENGGGLWFLSNDATVQYRMANTYRIRWIFEFQSKLYAIHSRGRAGAGLGSGGILEITRNATGQWESETMIRLAEAPKLTVVSANRVYILTDEHLGILNSDLTLTTVLRGPYKWGMLQPSSMVIDGPDLYIGTRWGVFKIKAFESKPEYGWYIPPSH